MEGDAGRQPGGALRDFGSGLLGGAAAWLLTVVLPVLGLTLLAVGVTLALVRVRARAARRVQELRTLAGLLVGSGALFLYGSWNTIRACSETDDFCGNANVVPLLATAIALLAVGLAIVAALATSARRARSSSPDS